MTSVAWKSAEILKVFGTTIREGTFTGSKPTTSGQIVTDSPTTFTPAKIAKMFGNIDTHVPIYIGHSADPDRKPVGYAYKFGVTETLDDIKYNGFVFDPEAVSKIAMEGWDKVSPEISEDDEHLLAITFVPNPAISGTEADMEVKVFSQGESKDQTVMTESVSNQSATPAAPVVSTSTESTSQQPSTPSVSTPREVTSTPDVSALVAQVEEYRAKFEKEAARNETYLTQQYDGIVAEMKSLGVDDPAAIVRGLPVENKISVLSKMKESIAKTKPLATPTTSTTTEPKQSGDKSTALKEVLEELGISDEMYSEIAGKK